MQPRASKLRCAGASTRRHDATACLEAEACRREYPEARCSRVPRTGDASAAFRSTQGLSTFAYLSTPCHVIMVMIRDDDSARIAERRIMS